MGMSYSSTTQPPAKPFDLEKAIRAHIDWLGRLMQALQHNQSPAGLKSETVDVSCLFGRWLAEATIESAHDAAALLRVEACHQAMHGLASALLLTQRRDEEYYTTLDRFCRSAIEFNRLLASLDVPSVPAAREAAAKPAAQESGERPGVRNFSIWSESALTQPA